MITSPPSPPEGWPDDFYKSQVEAFQYNGVQYAHSLRLGLRWLLRQSRRTRSRRGRDADRGLDVRSTPRSRVEDQGERPQPGRAMGLRACRPRRHDTGWIVRSFGGKQVTADPLTSHFNDPKTIAAYQYLYDAIWTHQVMPGARRTASHGVGERGRLRQRPRRHHVLAE